MGKSVYEIVTERIVEKIEEALREGDILPWQKPWIFADAPKNYVSQRCYRGINSLLLDPGDYLTWNQLCDLSKKDPALRLRKGAKGSLVVYFKVLEKENAETGEDEKIPMLRYYKVFNAKDVRGLEPRKQKYFVHEPIAEAEQIMTDYLDREKIKVSYELGDKACYSPISDKITLPERKQFANLSEFYGTAFHEMAHSTGHEKRLNRKLRNAFADSEYSKEELVAEMTAAMLLGQCGILVPSVENNSVAYLKGWMEAIKGNPTMVVSASAQAQRAADFILNATLELAA